MNKQYGSHENMLQCNTVSLKASVKQATLQSKYPSAKLLVIATSKDKYLQRK